MKELLSRLEHELTARARDLRDLDGDEQYRLLASKTEKILPEDVVLERLRRSRASGEPLVVKLGVDPTSPDLHLGHAVPLMLLRRFQDLGHEVILIVGDFTAQVGDPAGRVQERPSLTREEIETNFRTYREQAGKILDLDRVQVRHNSEWLDPVTLPELLRILEGINLSASLQREDFRARIEKGYSLSIAEVLYSVLMGLDSVALECDLEIGGIDQLLNLQMCREVMQNAGLPPEGIVCTAILEGISGDGSKMSKSLGNTIALTDPPEEIYGKVMRIPDRLLEPYFRLTTELRPEDWDRLAAGMESGAVNPRDVKALLARVLVATLWGCDRVAEAQAHFDRVIRDKSAPQEIDSVELARDEWGTTTLLDVLERGGMIATRSEGRRLHRQGAIRWRPSTDGGGDFEKLEADTLPAPPAEGILKIGKRKFLRVTPV